MDDKTRKELAEAGRRKLEEFRRRKQQQEGGGGGASSTVEAVVETREQQQKQEDKEKDAVVKTSVAFPGATAIKMMEDQSNNGSKEENEIRAKEVTTDSGAGANGTKYEVLDDGPVFSKEEEKKKEFSGDRWTVGNALFGTRGNSNANSSNEFVMPTKMNLSSFGDDIVDTNKINESLEQGAASEKIGTSAPGFHANDYLIPVARGETHHSNKSSLETAETRKEEKESITVQEIDENKSTKDIAENRESADGFKTDIDIKTQGVGGEVSLPDKNDVTLSDPREQHARRKEFERLEEHIDKLTSEKIDLSLCLEKQTELVHRITDENETMIRRLNEASSQQEGLMEQLGAYEKDKIGMQSLIEEYNIKLETKEKEAKDLQTKIRVLGNELVRLEEDLLREKNERLRISSQLSSNQEMDNSKEAAAWEKERFILESQREQMKRALDALQGSLEEAEAKLAEFEKQQHTASGHEEEVRKIPPLPHSAIIAAQAMRECEDGSEATRTASSIPLEIQALLPRTTWIPGIETLQTDINQAAERIFAHVKQMEDRQENSLTNTRVSSENTEI